MNTNFRDADEVHPMGEDATLPIARLAIRQAALLLLAGTTLPRRRAWLDNSPAAHSAASNCAF